MKSKTTSLVKPVFVIVLISAIAGCASNAQKYSNQPAVAVGSTVELNFNANLPVDQDRIYIQNQTIVSKASRGVYAEDAGARREILDLMRSAAGPTSDV